MKKIKEGKPQLVLLDLILPGIDGFEVCRQIREKLKEGTKIIVMTGSIDAVDAVKARKFGADDYCVKTSDASTFIEAVKKLA